MKKLKATFVATITIFFMSSFLHSCLDDSESPLLGIGTIRVIDGYDYYFLLDNGDKILPGDTTAIHNYTVEDGKRVIVYFYTINENVTGYKYNGRIVYIENILTKSIIPMTEETADSIGDDPINLTNIWFAGNCLNLEFQMMGTPYPTQKHMINLVKNEIPGANDGIDEEGYITLEFRHNAYKDAQEKLLSGIVAIKHPFAPDNETAQGIKIRVKTIYDGVKYYKIEFTNNTSDRALFGHDANYSSVN